MILRMARPRPAGALIEMLARDQANGIDAFDRGPAPEPGPPETSTPIFPPAIPPVDWRQEELDRARRNNPDPTPDELAPPPPQSLQAHPARPRRGGS